MNELFSKSETFKQEYCATLVKVGKLVPIEGSDFLVQTMVNGFSIVVRKDEVNEGDLMVYCGNETQICDGFLASNNLYEMGERERNANHAAVQALVDEGKQEEAKRMVGFFNKHGRVKLIKLRGCPSFGFLFKLENLATWMPSIMRDPSFQSLLRGWNTDNMAWQDFDFDTVMGVPFIKAYIPPMRGGNMGGSRGNKRDSRLKRFDRIVPGGFSFHYDTAQLNRNIHRLTPTDVVDITVKVHGTSAIYGNVLVNKPVQLTPLQKAINKSLLDIKRKLDSLRRNGIGRRKGNKEYARLLKQMVIAKSRYTNPVRQAYGNVYSSRSVIKNQYINPGVNKGYYDVDVWGEYNELLKDVLPEGITVYGEIFGYITGEERMIQKGYDYGCPSGKNRFMPYRITESMNGGGKREYDVSEVIAWTKELIQAHPNLKDCIMGLPLLYHGTLADLYPEIACDGEWNDNVLDAMKHDVDHFGMEKREPLCKNKVPREGIVLRISYDPIAEAFKLKTTAFLQDEGKKVDTGDVTLDI